MLYGKEEMGRLGNVGCFSIQMGSKEFFSKMEGDDYSKISVPITCPGESCTLKFNFSFIAGLGMPFNNLDQQGLGGEPVGRCLNQYTQKSQQM